MEEGVADSKKKQARGSRSLKIHAIAKNEYHQGDSSNIDPRLIISDVPIALFCSRAHPEEKALATVTGSVVPQFFEEGLPSWGSLGFWSWNS
ncbi:dolichyl-phosphate beta-glucosyltransferase [Vigna unguiculata]|uniref:Dolichyl-phosphate beta-glucosyltransferase n=1 Tax=Vigna unguiculata TaxID=3917 RepID=A0A4D6LQI8_VIGUN|nr:dolichyl-phosphate beta-glucosyltransferase [Vigna unguiculata]